MNNKRTPTALPKLRFPEFWGAGEWVVDLLGDLYTFKTTNSLSREKLNYGNGSVKNIHYGDIHTKFSTLFDIEKEIVPFINSSESLDKIKSESYCIESDLILADASEDIEDIGKSIEIVNINNEKLLSGLHTLLARQRHEIFIIGFVGYLFKSNGIRSQIKKESQGAKILGVSATRLSNIDVSYPSDKKEQQKIAECLSSLDGLITAQNKKLEALQQHKKGLMQQLFPAAGETTPKRRFPQFGSAPAWEDEKIADIASLKKGNGLSKSKLTQEGRYKCILYGELFTTYNENIDQIKSRTNSNEGLCSLTGDILIPASTTTSAIDLAKARLINEDNVLLGGDINVIRPIDKYYINSMFLAYMLTHIKKYDIAKLAQGITIIHLYSTSLSKLRITIPDKKEQQKIANCLSSIDELITAQSQKVDALQQHKKGLMQQLFPNN